MEEYIKLLDLPDEFDLAILKKAYRKMVLKYHPDKAKNDTERVEFEAKMKMLNEANEYLKEYLERHDGKYTKSTEEYNEYTQSSYDDYSETNNYEDNNYSDENTQEEETQEEAEEEVYEDEYEEAQEVEENNELSNLTLMEKIEYAIKLLLNPKLLEDKLKKSNSNPFAPIFQSPKNMLIFFTLVVLILYPIYEWVDKYMYPNTNTNNEQKQEIVQDEHINNSNQQSSNPDSNNTVTLDNSTEIGRYMGNIQRHIKSNWDLPKNIMAEKGFDEVKVEVEFTVAKDGNLIGEPKIKKSSGLDIVDKRCLEAVELSAPFKPIPSDIPRDSLDMSFTFEADRY